MDWSIAKALPIGLVLFVGMAWRFFLRRTKHRRAHEDYPALADRLGLEYRAPRSSEQIGKLQGTLRGFLVFVDPDEQRKLIVRFRGQPAIDLRTYETPHPPARLPYFSSALRTVDQFFKTRRASPEMASRLKQADLESLIAPFDRDFRGELRQLNLTQDGVTCVVDFGNPPHIPAAAVEKLLSALLDWAEVIEPLGSSTGQGGLPSTYSLPV